jgi:four helix bundle suffix protein
MLDLETELKLTSVSRASPEELCLDYEDFLRQRGLSQWDRSDPRRESLVARRFTAANEVAAWAREIYESRRGPSGPSRPGRHETQTSTYPEIAANAALALIAVAVSLLERQLDALAKDFEQEGGFTERLFRFRQARRRGH